MSRAVVAFPGRVSFRAESLRSLRADHPWVAAADELRAAAGLPPLGELDAAPFDPRVHLRPTNAWPLTFLVSLLDAERIAADHEVVTVVASSTGWYTALAAAGVVGFEDALRILTELARAAEDELPDGIRPAELVEPMTDDGWQPMPEREEAVRQAIEASDGEVDRVLELGSHTILGGPASAIDEAAGRLPPVAAAGRSFPLRIPADGWHTPLRTDAAARATERIGDVDAARPNVAVVDGEGVRHTPWTADPDALIEAAITRQPLRTSHFALALRVALREYAPEVVLLPGPGSSLGAACAQVIVAEGYRGIRSREEFEQTQAGGNPILLSMRR